MVSSSHPLEGKRILIVDDEAMIALELNRVVISLGGTVAIANSIEEAIDILDRVLIDCAILDVNIEGNLSYPVASALRKRDIPFFYFTAHAEAASVFPPSVAAPRIRKPLRKHELEDQLLRLLNRAKT